MSEPADALFEVRRPSRTVAAAGTWVTATGCLVLAGYSLDLPAVVRVVPFGTFQAPATAVAFALSGVALILVAPRAVSRARRFSGVVLGLLVALFGGVILGEYATGRSTGIDLVLFPDTVRAWSSTTTPGRPAVFTAMLFVVVGLSLALLDADPRHGHRPARVLVPAVVLLTSIAICGYLYGVGYLRGSASLNGIALNSAVAFCVLVVGIVASRPERPPADVLAGRGPGGDAMRRLAPAATATMFVSVSVTAIGRSLHPIDEGIAVTAASALMLVAVYALLRRAGIALDEAGDTQRRLLEELRDERDFIQTVLYTLGEGVLVLAPDGTVIQVNPRWCEITGWTAADAVGMRPPYPWRPPEEMAGWAANLTAILDSDAAVERDIVVRRPDGTNREVQVTAVPMFDRNTGLRMLVSTFRDLTERNRAEAERRHAAEQLDQFFDLSGDLLCVASSGGVLRRVNPAWEQALGYRVEDLVGRDYRDFVHPEDVSAEGTKVRSGPGTTTSVFENRYRHRDGSYRWLTWNATSILDSGLVFAVGRDTTVARQAEASQRAAEERTHQSERMASLGQLAGGVAHDFNNLLGIILNFTAFAAEQAPDDDTIQGDLTQVRSAADRAVGLARQLLTFTRQDAIRPETLDINASIAETHAMLARTIGEHIELIAVPSPIPIMIYADAGHIQQILVNLAINARDAMCDGGTLVIEAAEVDLDEHQTDLRPAPAAGRYVRILVSDTGTGMTAETIAHIFEPFYTTKPKGQGTGLGLATVYGIVAEAGGSIHVYSEPGIGTTFRVYFPIAEAPGLPMRARPDTASAPRGDGQIVLVVEDEPALSQAVVRILDSGGYRSLHANSGPQALAMDTDHGCDLLLTDIVMPDMSGRRVAELLHERHPNLPVLYMSGYTNGLLGTTHILEQGIAFIEKPFTAHLLLTEIGKAFAAAGTGPARTPAGAD